MRRLRRIVPSKPLPFRTIGLVLRLASPLSLVLAIRSSVRCPVSPSQSSSAPMSRFRRRKRRLVLGGHEPHQELLALWGYDPPASFASNGQQHPVVIDSKFSKNGVLVAPLRMSYSPLVQSSGWGDAACPERLR